jgi:hypothetical protein
VVLKGRKGIKREHMKRKRKREEEKMEDRHNCVVVLAPFSVWFFLGFFLCFCAKSTKIRILQD